MIRTALIAVFFLIGMLSAFALRPSQTEPDRLAWLADPQTIYVRPGNFGLFLFRDEETSDPANLLPTQDEYSNAIAVTLVAADYHVSLSDEDSQTTRPYLDRLQGWMESLAWTGQMPVLTVTDDFMAEYERKPEIADKLTSSIQKLSELRLPPPAVVIDVSTWGDDIAALITQWRRKLPSMLIGLRLTKGTLTLPRTTRFDFVLCDEELIPEHYRGQAAAQWVQGQAGQVPVILSPMGYDFFRDVVWISCGVAGIWYRPLPSEETAQVAAAVQLRASTTFLNRFWKTFLPLATKPGHPTFLFALEETGAGWAGVLQASAAAFNFSAPAGLAGKLVGRSWYNPATDQTIIQPLTRLPATVSVQSPDANQWIYTITAVDSAAATQTTITEIQQLPPWP